MLIQSSSSDIGIVTVEFTIKIKSVFTTDESI